MKILSAANRIFRNFNSNGLVVFVFSLIFQGLSNAYALVPIEYQEVPQKSITIFQRFRPNISIKDESYRIFDLEIEFIWVGYPQESGQ